ncbi:hypothetical protein [Metasolibacillus meyeri]|uniref:hypothetical protein n=1 Tax=Metasolibacillus meyeri TaxID=1071052 RepID=UPI000D325647|nr:hypothetical protein [Metasolibacillus meyeri]
MEAIIGFIVIAIISSLFNSKKEKPKNTKSMPPFNEQSQPKNEPRQTKTKPARTLEDFANEIFGQLEQKKAEVEQQWQASKPVPPKSKTEPVVVEKVEVPEVIHRPSTARQNIEQTPRVAQMKERETAVFTPPTTKKALIQAVVAAEIIGLPKAKQRQVR